MSAFAGKREVLDRLLAECEKAGVTAEALATWSWAKSIPAETADFNADSSIEEKVTTEEYIDVQLDGVLDDPHDFMCAQFEDLLEAVKELQRPE